MKIDPDSGGFNQKERDAFHTTRFCDKRPEDYFRNIIPAPKISSPTVINVSHIRMLKAMCPSERPNPAPRRGRLEVPVFPAIAPTS
jgi:hypothetical protein